jgi:beta-glucosidase
MKFACGLLFAFVVMCAPEAVVAADHSAVKPVPRSGGWLKRHESFNARVAKGNADLLMIGDSITHGWEGSGKKVWQEYYGKRNAVNLGIGGDRTQHVLWRLENGNIKNITPKLAVIMIGTNNARSNSAEEIYDGVAAIVAKLRKELPEMKILVLAIFPRGANDDNKLRQNNMAANKMIVKLGDNKMVHIMNINAAFLAKDEKRTYLSTGLTVAGAGAVVRSWSASGSRGC